MLKKRVQNYLLYQSICLFFIKFNIIKYSKYNFIKQLDYDLAMLIVENLYEIQFLLKKY